MKKLKKMCTQIICTALNRDEEFPELVKQHEEAINANIVMMWFMSATATERGIGCWYLTSCSGIKILSSHLITVLEYCAPQDDEDQELENLATHVHVA